MQQLGSEQFVHRPPPPPLPPPPKRSTGQNSTLSEHGHVAYQINGNHKITQHGNKLFSRRTPLSHYPRDLGQKVKIQLCQNMVMLHIKFIGITKCSNMVANILPADPPPTTPYPRGQKVKI